MKINQILSNIDQHTICIPAFQREYVWKKDNAKQLIYSLLRDFPVGTLLTWTTHNPPELKGKCKDHAALKGATQIVLDGQQRITTLYMLIRGEIPPYYTPEEITYDIRGLYINLQNLDLQYYRPILMAKDPLWKDITQVFAGNIKPFEVIKDLKESGVEVNDELQSAIWENITRVQNILNFDMPEQVVPPDANIKTAIDIFYIVNASGVNLTEAELALAQISGYWPEARDIFKRKLDELAQHGFVFSLDFVVYVLLGILYQSGHEMEKLHDAGNLEGLQHAWERLSSKTLDYVMNLMQQSAYIDHTKEINSVYALVPIIVYCYRKGDTPLTQDEIGKMVRWFYFSQIRNRYISQLQQKLTLDNKVAFNSKTPFDDLLNTIKAERPLDVVPEEFAGAGVGSPLWGLMRWYFKSRGAVCFTTGVGIRRPMGEKYSLEWDHIFAFAQLKARGYGRENRVKYSLAQEITNRAVLTQTANRSKSDELASNYLAKVAAAYPDALRLQAIPENPALWEIENFEEFLAVRRRRLAGELNDFLNSLATLRDTKVQTPLEDIIAVRESNDVEFKSTLTWSIQAGIKDKGVEHAVLKTLAAFANSEGGTLLIGVDDNGIILGLENDYTALHGDRDEFELRLRELSDVAFGQLFTKLQLAIAFEELPDGEVCRVEVSRSERPVFLKQENRQQFYVRSGNRTVEMQGNEASAYQRQHFSSAVA